MEATIIPDMYMSYLFCKGDFSFIKKKSEFCKMMYVHAVAIMLKLSLGDFFSFCVFYVSVNPISFVCWCFSFFLYTAWLSRHRFFSNEQYSNSSSWSQWIPQRESFPTRNRNLLPADNRRGKRATILNDLRLDLRIGTKLYKLILVMDNATECNNIFYFKTGF